MQDLAAEDDIVEADPESAFDDREARFCLKWLNRNVMDQPVDEERFPHCIIETNGNVMVDCVEALCGRKLQEVRKVDQEEARPASGALGSAASSRIRMRLAGSSCRYSSTRLPFFFCHQG